MQCRARGVAALAIALTFILMVPGTFPSGNDDLDSLDLGAPAASSNTSSPLAAHTLDSAVPSATSTPRETQLAAVAEDRIIDINRSTPSSSIDPDSPSAPRWSTITSTPVAGEWYLDETEKPPPDNLETPTPFDGEPKKNDDAAIMPPQENTLVSQYGVQCIQEESCAFYQDVLLVIKLNPVRLLWLDALLNFYGTAFKHIVFYSALRKGDDSKKKWLRVGGRRVFVRLLEDNYGFCDHANIADASLRHQHKNFSGFIYLSDDVFMMFWKFLGHDKTALWKQKPSIGAGAAKSKDRIDKATMNTILELNERHGYNLSTTRHLFARTSGCYYVPNNPQLMERFRFISGMLLKYRSYNEWGTPFLLGSILVNSTKFPPLDKKVDVLILWGELLWGKKRLFPKIIKFAYSWSHPVRANGETFLRWNLLVHDPANRHLGPKSKITPSQLWEETGCLNCASFPIAQIRGKGLLHDCVVSAANSARPGSTNKEDKNNKSKEEEWCNPQMWLPEAELSKANLPTAGLIGGRVVVPPGRMNQLSPVELAHEGLWNKNITVYMYETHYQAMNRTRHSGMLLSGFPKCCYEP